ncbi:MAG: DUF5113 domain-containing protein [Bacteroidaceae bacterium]|nr:DUF5113 domain-containing protein [Bacteroidaceae bacterium]
MHKRIFTLIYIITLCSALSWAQGNDFSSGREWLKAAKEQFEKGDYDSALYLINKADIQKGQVQTEPELEADIHELYCLIFSAKNNKHESDYHRNMYLDIREHARKDLQLEQKAKELQREAQIMSVKMTLLAIAIIALILISMYFRQQFMYDGERGRRVLKKKDYDEIFEEQDERLAVLRHKLTVSKEQNADKQAKLFVVNSLSPLIARLRYTLTGYKEGREGRAEKTYALELIENIEQHNNLLTEWISLEQGRLSLKIETFSIGELFELLKKNNKTFAQQGIQFSVAESETRIKADKVLTLFMLNTLADNARKAIRGEGGMVKISCEEKDGNVAELSVTDNGIGMTQEQADKIFSNSIVNGHGFGLLNCRGIINSYKKTGTLFRDCMIGVESEVGKGSRFYFRLPRIVMSVVMMLFAVTMTIARPTRYTEQIDIPILRQAADYADSTYYLNIDGKYALAMEYAFRTDSCLTAYMSDAISPDSILVKNIIVDVCNEAAVASLALHNWDDYHYFNSTYERVHKELTTNHEMEEYCRKHSDYLSSIVSVWLIANMLFTIVCIVVAVHLYYLWKKRSERISYRDSLHLDDRASLIRQVEYETESLHISNNLLANALSAIKHETMYYPSRIKTLLQNNAPAEEILEMSTFYEQLFTNLTGTISRQKLPNGVRISCVDGIRADKDLYHYMMHLIKKYLNVSELSITERTNGQYREMHIDTNGKDASNCFSPTPDNIPMLISRQIIREMGNESFRGCGIIAEKEKIVIRIAKSQVP